MKQLRGEPLTIRRLIRPANSSSNLRGTKDMGNPKPTPPRSALLGNATSHRPQASYGVSPWKATNAEGSFTNMESLMYGGRLEEA